MPESAPPTESASPTEPPEFCSFELPPELVEVLGALEALRADPTALEPLKVLCHAAAPAAARALHGWLERQRERQLSCIGLVVDMSRDELQARLLLRARELATQLAIAVNRAAKTDTPNGTLDLMRDQVARIRYLARHLPPSETFSLNLDELSQLHCLINWGDVDTKAELAGLIDAEFGDDPPPGPPPL